MLAVFKDVFSVFSKERYLKRPGELVGFNHMNVFLHAYNGRIQQVAQVFDGPYFFKSKQAFIIGGPDDFGIIGKLFPSGHELIFWE